MAKKNKWRKRVITSVKFSAIIGVSYWATTVYEKAFALNSWILAFWDFLIVAGVMLLFGGTLLDVMEID